MKLKNIVKAVLSVCIMLTAFMFVGCDNNALKEINYVNGTIQTSIRQGDTLDLTNAEVEVTFSKGNTEIISATDLEFSTFDSSILGDQTLTITYKGKSVNVVVNVYKYVTSVSLELNKIIVEQNDQLNLDNLVFIETYSDSSTERITSGYTITQNIDTTVLGKQTLKVAYNNREAELEITVIEHTESIYVKANSVSNKAYQYYDYDLSNLVVVAVSSNGNEEEFAYSTHGTEITIGEINTNIVEGNSQQKSFKVTFQLSGSDEKFETTVNYTVWALDSIAYTGDEFSGYQYREPNTENVNLQVLATYKNGDTCTFNNINKLLVEFGEIDNENGIANIKLKSNDTYIAQYHYNNIALDYITANLTDILPTRTVYGETIDRSDLVVTAYWQEVNGYVYSEVVWDNENQEDLFVNFIFDETTVGVQDYTVSYYGKTVSQEIEVTYLISSFEKPAFVSAYQTNSAKQNTYLTTGSGGQPGFTETNNTYVVGTDNAFIFEPILKVMNLELETTEQLKSFNKDIAVYVLVDSEYQKLDMSEEEKVLYFTKNNIEYLTVQEQTKYFFTSNAVDKMFKIEVYPASLTEDEEDNVDIISFEFKVTEGYNVYNVADFSVLDNTNAKLTEDTHNGLMINKSNYSSTGKWSTLKEQNGIDLSVNTSKIILHSNIQITLNDIPSIHYYEQGGSNYLVDSKDFITGSIYTRYLAQNETFTLEGNYFTIDISSLPRIVREDGKTSDNDNDKPATTHTAFLRVLSDNAQAGTFNMNNVEIFGNSPKTDNNVEWGGVMFAKFYHINSNVNNCLSQRWFISFLYDGDESIADNCVNRITNTNCFDANNSLLYIFGARLVYIENSIMIGAGGPVMIVDHVQNEEPHGGYVSNVKVKNSTLESWVSGEESWFVGFNATQVASQIKALNELTSSPYLNKNFLKTIKDENENEVSMMNIIAVYKSSSAEGFTASKIYSTFEDLSTDADKNRIHDYVMHSEVYYGDYCTHLCTTNGGNVVIDNNGNPDYSTVTASAQAFQTSEDYLILHYLNGMCIILGFNE